MLILKIKSVKGYKSFIDFQWDKFCKNKDGKEIIIPKFTTIFGENGTGKSSLCLLLKDISGSKLFEETKPEYCEIEIKDDSNNTSTYVYQNESWTPGNIDKHSLLFFDVDFVNDNIHTHGDRSNQQGRHSQNSGQLIIDLDQKANSLKQDIFDKKEEIDKFERLNQRLLELQLNEKELKLFTTYKDLTDIQNKEALLRLIAEKKDIQESIAKLEKLNKKYADVTKINRINEIPSVSSISSESIYSEIFSREIKQKAQEGADESIKKHFEEHRKFIETAREEIPEDYKNANCPLCMQPLSGALETIEFYKNAFDNTYENEKKKLIKDIEILKEEINQVRSSVFLLAQSVTAIFNNLEKLSNDFEIDGIYKLEEKTLVIKNLDLVKNPPKEFEQIINGLEKLKSIEREKQDISELYKVSEAYIKRINTFIKTINDLIKSKNELIDAFKGKYSDQSKIKVEIDKNSVKDTELQESISFLDCEKIKDKKDQDRLLVDKKVLTDSLKKLQDELTKHLAEKIPESVINQMIAIVGEFNLNFTLEHIKPAPNTKDYSFSFKIKDSNGLEREMKDGLSEGERQLISIAFFFAINENLPDKDKKIVIFDDPITSLDAPNLKILAELIHDQTNYFAQVIVLTHHPLFFKYISKCENPNPCKLGIVKNKEEYGGAFMFYDPGFDMVEEVKKCNQEINEEAKKGNLRVEGITLKYGQLLRLTVEKFIKNELLMWDKERNFPEVANDLKSSRSKIMKLNDEDLELIKNIYKYCDYSNLLHFDKESPSALSELMSHISKFSAVLDKVNK